MAFMKQPRNWDRRIKNLIDVCKFDESFQYTIYYSSLNAMMKLAIQESQDLGQKDGIFKILKAAEIPLAMSFDVGNTDKDEIEKACQDFLKAGGREASEAMADKTAPNTPDASDDEGVTKDFRAKLKGGREQDQQPDGTLAKPRK